MQSANRSFWLALAGLALAIPVTVSAAPEERETVKWYDLEVIIFRHADPRSDEKWPIDDELPQVGELQALYPPSDENEDKEQVETQPVDAEEARALVNAPEPWTPLPEDMLTMRNYSAALDRSSRYETLLHFAWSQPSLEREESQKVRITLPGALDEMATEEETVEEEERENSFGDEFATSTSATSPEDDEIAPDAMIENESSKLARPLDGYMRLGVGHYLHVEMDLLYLPDDVNPDIIDGELPQDDEFSDEERQEKEERRRAIMEALARGDISMEEADILMLEPEEQVFHGFRINNVRRIRAGEVHYFDHPVYGVILKAMPREIEVAEPETSQR